MEQKAERLFVFTIIFTFLIKTFLSITIPLTGDEAYFVLWGRHLDYGYYDHTPMIGWLMHLMLSAGNSQFLVRLPAIISSILVGTGIYFIVKPFDKTKACLLATLFLVSPINVLNVLISTDTPLLLFSFVSAGFLFYALKQKNYLHYCLSGGFLGLAFLSKYFAVLLGLSYLIYFIMAKKSKDRYIGFLILFLSVIPFAAVNLYWNYTHSWANIMFNLFNRAGNEHLSALKFLLFVLILLYFFTPPVLYYLFIKRKEIFLKLKTGEFAFFSAVFAVPLLILCILSFKKAVGVHWVLSFYPFLYIVLFLFLRELEIIKSIKFMVFFTLAHLVIAATVLSLPPKYFKNTKMYYEIILGEKPQAVLYNLKQYEKDFILMTPSYTDSAILSYYSGMYFPVFDAGSHHGRQDDFITNFKNFDEKDILVLKEHLPDKEKYGKYFKHYEVKQFEIDGAVFYTVLGYGFNFSNYRDIALKKIKEKYYPLPKYLPVKSDYFEEKYFQ